jgi:hypothetical protein
MLERDAHYFYRPENGGTKKHLEYLEDSVPNGEGQKVLWEQYLVETGFAELCRRCVQEERLRGYKLGHGGINKPREDRGR